MNDVNEAMNDVNEAVDDVNEAVDDVNEAVDDVNEAVDDVDEAVDDINEAVDDVNEAMNDVNEAMNDVNEAMNNVDGTVDYVKDSMLLKFTPVLKNGKTFYHFETFENVKPKWELPCEYLSGLHFTAWDRVLLYSDGVSLRKALLGSEISEEEYLELMRIVELGKERLKEIRAKSP